MLLNLGDGLRSAPRRTPAELITRSTLSRKRRRERVKRRDPEAIRAPESRRAGYYYYYYYVSRQLCAANNTRRRKTRVNCVCVRVCAPRRKSHDFTPIFPEVSEGSSTCARAVKRRRVRVLFRVIVYNTHAVCTHVHARTCVRVCAVYTPLETYIDITTRNFALLQNIIVVQTFCAVTH